ncbi:MAG: DUF1161 domain-containing protein [Vicinamibacterales bacterium]
MAVHVLSILAVLMIGGPASAAAQPAPCEALAEEIGAKLEANGVPYFRLTIVRPEDVKGRTIVGTCEFGARRVVYERLEGPDGAGTFDESRDSADAPPAPPTPPATPEAPAPVPARVAPAAPTPPSPPAPPAPAALSIAIDRPAAGPLGALREVSGTARGGTRPQVAIRVYDDEARQVWNGRAWQHVAPDAGLDPWLPATTAGGRWSITGDLPGPADLQGRERLRVTARLSEPSGRDAITTRQYELRGDASIEARQPADGSVAAPPEPAGPPRPLAEAVMDPPLAPLAIPDDPDALVAVGGIDPAASAIRIRRADLEDLRDVAIAAGMDVADVPLATFVRRTSIGLLPDLTGVASGDRVDYLLIEISGEIDSQRASMVLRNRAVLMAEPSSMVIGLLPEQHEGLHDLCVAVRDTPTPAYLYSYWVFEYTGARYIRRSRAWGTGTCDGRVFSVVVRRN